MVAADVPFLTCVPSGSGARKGGRTSRFGHVAGGAFSSTPRLFSVKAKVVVVIPTFRWVYNLASGQPFMSSG